MAEGMMSVLRRREGGIGRIDVESLKGFGGRRVWWNAGSGNRGCCGELCRGLVRVPSGS